MDVDVAKITVSGPGLTDGGITGQKCVINMRGVPRHFFNDLTIKCDGPKKPDVMHNLEDETVIELFFVPVAPGDYKLTIRFRGKQITGSPFVIKVTGDALDVAKLISKVTVQGRAVEFGKVYTSNEFLVDTNSVKPIIGALRVQIKGPERTTTKLNIVDNGNGTFKIAYTPALPGMYSLTLKIAEENIPGSPFPVHVS